MAGKLRIAVLMGGKSPEHEISLISGRQVVSNLNPQKYDVIPIVISRDGRSLRLNNKKYSLSQLSIVNCFSSPCMVHMVKMEQSRDFWNLWVYFIPDQVC